MILSSDLWIITSSWWKIRTRPTFRNCSIWRLDHSNISDALSQGRLPPPPPPQHTHPFFRLPFFYRICHRTPHFSRVFTLYSIIFRFPHLSPDTSRPRVFTLYSILFLFPHLSLDTSLSPRFHPLLYYFPFLALVTGHLTFPAFSPSTLLFSFSRTCHRTPHFPRVFTLYSIIFLFLHLSLDTSLSPRFHPVFYYFPFPALVTGHLTFPAFSPSTLLFSFSRTCHWTPHFPRVFTLYSIIFLFLHLSLDTSLSPRFHPVFYYFPFPALVPDYPTFPVP